MQKTDFEKYLSMFHKDRRTIKNKIRFIHRLRWHEIQKINKDTKIPFDFLKNKDRLELYFLQKKAEAEDDTRHI